MSIPLSSHYDNVFVHKGGKLERRQFLAKMHQIAPNCVSNFTYFPCVTHPDPHPWGGDTPFGHSMVSPLRVLYSPPETNGWIKPCEGWRPRQVLHPSGCLSVCPSVPGLRFTGNRRAVRRNFKFRGEI